MAGLDGSMVENERSVVNEPQGQTLITAEYFDTNVHMIRRHMCPQTMILLYYELTFRSSF